MQGFQVSTDLGFFKGDQWNLDQIWPITLEKDLQKVLAQLKYVRDCVSNYQKYGTPVYAYLKKTGADKENNNKDWVWMATNQSTLDELKKATQAAGTWSLEPRRRIGSMKWSKLSQFLNIRNQELKW